MARRNIPMNEVVEVLYQWHKGRKISQIGQSLGMDRKTVRKHIRSFKSSGISQNGPFPDEQELVARLKDVLHSPAYEHPVLDLVTKYRSDIEAWLKDPNMTGKQIWRLLKENFNINVGYTTIKRYLRKEFSFGRPKVTVRIETPPELKPRLISAMQVLYTIPTNRR